MDALTLRAEALPPASERLAAAGPELRARPQPADRPRRTHRRRKPSEPRRLSLLQRWMDLSA
jgi:hypothetical protein